VTTESYIEDVEVALTRLLSSDSPKFHDVMSTHLGRDICGVLDELQSSLDIFKDSVSDLLVTMSDFHQLSRQPIAWRNLDDGAFTTVRRTVLKELFAATASAMSLVDHTRRLVNAGWSVPGYRDRVAQFFHGDGLHEVIQGLRNFLLHRSVLLLAYKLRSPKPGNRSFFFIPQYELLTFENWKKEALRYIKLRQEGIEVEDLFQTYLARVCEFHAWFSQALRAKHEPSVTEYRLYEKVLKKASIRGVWHRLLASAKARDFDPYAVLPSALTEKELQEVLILEPRSRQQVDRIIELFDYHGACDNALRQKVYELFSEIRSKSIGSTEL
jgi:hypothetical protein